MMGALPDELLCAVFAHLPCLVLRSAVLLVCRRWHDVAGDPVALQRHVSCIDATRTMKRPNRWCDAAASGHLLCLAHARRRLGLAWGATTCQAAAREGRLDCLRFAHVNGCPWDRNTTRVSAADGHLDCFLYASRNGCAIDYESVDAAARNGHADILGAIGATPSAHTIDAWTCERAAAGGHLDVIRRPLQMGVVPDPDSLTSAIYAGHMATIKYLIREHGMRPRWGEFSHVGARGSLDLIRYLCETSDDDDGIREMASAAIGKHRRAAALYLLERGTPVSISDAKRIVKHGWADVIDVVCATDVDWAESVARWSIDYGRIQCLERALERGAAADWHLVKRAAGCGQVAMIDLLVARGAAWTVRAMHEAACNGHVEALSGAQLAGIRFDADALASAAANGHYEAVRYLCKRQCPVDDRARALAKACGHDEIVRYLADRGCP
ncbi:F-box domain containing protein [Pandoravirus salinus]|uniref:F-box domain containing protein n=1 Tax=Pandoravirus salinus TaxID=1349410 RepID=S4VYY1_9VIRU|nr:F-box domain [Pandoravirus salinus]AGO84696.1 F-box domain containing protein [Pandoravirus salinus]